MHAIAMTEEAVRFAEPVWLWVGTAGLVGLSLLIWWSERRRAEALSRLIAARHLSALTQTVSPVRRWIKHALLALAVACLFAALARPQWGYRFEVDKREGVDLLFAVDTSKSMLAPDVRPNRLSRAKLAVEDLVAKLPGARVGLIAFAGDAFVQTPLTLDRVAFQRSLAALDTDVIQVPGTNLRSAVRVAQQAFGSESEQHKLLVLLTDGEDLMGSVAEATRTAAASGITVHALGIGTSAGSTIPAAGKHGSEALLRDASGELVHSRLDEPALRQLASATGGSYRPLGEAGQGVEALYEATLSQLPKQLHSTRMRKVFYERFQWPLSLGVALLLLEWVLLDRRKQAKRSQTAAAAMALSCLGLAAFAAPAAAQDRSAVGTYNDATQHYRAGEFEAAAKGYTSTLQTRDIALQERAYYDLGNSLYRQGQATLPNAVGQTRELYQQAITAYESALALDEQDADAKYNRDFVRAQLEKLEQQREQDQSQSTKNDKNDQDNKNNDKSAQGDSQAGRSDQNQSSPSHQAGPQQSAQDQAQAAGPASAPDGDEGDQASGEQSQQPGRADADQPQPSGAARAQQPNDRADADRDASANPGGRQESRDSAHEPKPNTGDQARAAGTDGQPAGTAGSQKASQTGEPAVPGGLTREQARRLLDAMDGELQQLPSGYAGLVETTRDNQMDKDW